MSLSQIKVTAQLPLQPITLNELPSIPDPIGFAGSFAGVSNGTLLVAGGANFPDGGAPWTGSKKKWHDQIFALESPDGKWKLAGQLPQPLGYGASITWKNALIIIGGSNEKCHTDEVFMLQYLNGKIVRNPLPSLPKPIANTSGVVIDDVIYIAGGIESPDAKNTEKCFWALDLAAKQCAWKILDTWPGPSRMFAVTGAQNGNFYLFSGALFENGQRNYLKDAYQFNPKTGWKTLSDLPKPVTAAASPAWAEHSNLLIFGGDDGEVAGDAASLGDKHPGFSRRLLSYNTITDSWKIAAQLPAAFPVTTTLTLWNEQVVIPGGEVRPAVRTSKVLTTGSNNPK